VVWYAPVLELLLSLLRVRLNTGSAEPSNQIAQHSFCTEQRPATRGTWSHDREQLCSDADVYLLSNAVDSLVNQRPKMDKH